MVNRPQTDTGATNHSGNAKTATDAPVKMTPVQRKKSRLGERRRGKTSHNISRRTRQGSAHYSLLARPRVHFSPHTIKSNAPYYRLYSPPTPARSFADSVTQIRPQHQTLHKYSLYRSPHRRSNFMPVSTLCTPAQWPQPLSALIACVRARCDAFEPLGNSARPMDGISMLTVAGCNNETTVTS